MDLILTIILFVMIIALIPFIKSFAQKLGELTAINRDLKHQTTIIEQVRIDYSKNLELYKTQIEYLRSKSNLYGADEYNLSKKLSLKLLNFRDVFPEVRLPVFNSDKEVNEIIGELNLKGFDENEKIPHRDKVYIWMFYRLKETDELIREIKILSYEAEIFWTKEEFDKLYSIIEKYYDYKKAFNHYKIERDFREINKDNSNEEEYNKLRKLVFHWPDKKDSFQIELETLIENCLEVIKAKIKHSISSLNL